MYSYLPPLPELRNSFLINTKVYLQFHAQYQLFYQSLFSCVLPVSLHGCNWLRLHHFVRPPGEKNLSNLPELIIPLGSISVNLGSISMSANPPLYCLTLKRHGSP